MSVSSMMAEKRLRKHRKAFSSSGWNLHAREKGLASKLDNLDGPAFYLCDIETGQLHVVVTRADVFTLVEEKKQEEGVTFSEICDAFGSFYSDICTGKISLSSEASSILAFAVALYISGTQGIGLFLRKLWRTCITWLSDIGITQTTVHYCGQCLYSKLKSE